MLCFFWVISSYRKRSKWFISFFLYVKWGLQNFSFWFCKPWWKVFDFQNLWFVLPLVSLHLFPQISNWWLERTPKMNSFDDHEIPCFSLIFFRNFSKIEPLETQIFLPYWLDGRREGRLNEWDGGTGTRLVPFRFSKFSSVSQVIQNTNKWLKL